jgi:2'-5' RNA ligase
VDSKEGKLGLAFIGRDEMKKYNVVLWPEGRLMPQIRRLAGKLSRIGGKYDCIQVNPHFTLMTTFKTNRIDKIINEIRGQNFKKFMVTLKGPLLFNKNFVWFKAEKERMYKIHKKVIEIVRKYKSPWILPDYDVPLNKKQKEYRKKYSFPYVLEYFLPHMALAGFDFEDKRMPLIKKAIKKQMKIRMAVKNLYILTKKGSRWYLYRKIKLK